jgi:Protein of unknown function (DUF2771)
VRSTGRALTGVVLLGGLVAVTGCGPTGDGGAAAPKVTVQVGDQRVQLDPTQYCLDGDGRRYDTSPPVLGAPPGTSIRLTVPDVVATAGWSVQVFDEKLQQMIGEVEVDPDTAVFDKITTSDVVPPTFYLVVVEDADPHACSGLSGAWPVGIIRAEAGAGTSSAPGTTPAPASP